MKKTNTQKGITLIALIITIVILVVLAAVAISQINNDQLIGRSNSAATLYNQSKINEIEILKNYSKLPGLTIDVKTNSFKVSDVVYYSEQEMNWYTWCASEYNTTQYTCSGLDQRVQYNTGTGGNCVLYYEAEDGTRTYVYGRDIIEEREYYIEVNLPTVPF